MTRREAKAVEIVQRTYGYTVGADNDIVLAFPTTKLILEAMQWQANDCAYAWHATQSQYFRDNYKCGVFAFVANAGTEDV